MPRSAAYNLITNRFNVSTALSDAGKTYPGIEGGYTICKHDFDYPKSAFSSGTTQTDLSLQLANEQYPIADGQNLHLQKPIAMPDFPSNQAVQISKQFLSEDDSFELALPMQFTYFEQNYTSLFVSSNGYITFGVPDTSYKKSLNTHFDRARVSAFFEDLSPNINIYNSSDETEWYSEMAGMNANLTDILKKIEQNTRLTGRIYYEFKDCYTPSGETNLNVNSRIVITYVDVEKYGAYYEENRNTFQIALYFATGMVRLLWWDVMKFPPLDADGNGAVIVGISGGPKTAKYQTSTSLYLEDAYLKFIDSTPRAVNQTFVNQTTGETINNGTSIVQDNTEAVSVLNDVFGGDFTIETFYKVDFQDRAVQYLQSEGVDINQAPRVSIFSNRISADSRTQIWLDLLPDNSLEFKVSGGPEDFSDQINNNALWQTINYTEYSHDKMNKDGVTVNYKLPYSKWVHLALTVERQAKTCFDVTIKSCTRVILWADGLKRGEYELDEGWYYTRIANYDYWLNTTSTTTTTFFCVNGTQNGDPLGTNCTSNSSGHFPIYGPHPGGRRRLNEQAVVSPEIIELNGVNVTNCTNVTNHTDGTYRLENCTNYTEPVYVPTTTSTTTTTWTGPFSKTGYLKWNFDSGQGFVIGGGGFGNAAARQAQYFSKFRMYKRALKPSELAKCRYGADLHESGVARNGLMVSFGFDQTLTEVANGVEVEIKGLSTTAVNANAIQDKEERTQVLRDFSDEVQKSLRFVYDAPLECDDAKAELTDDLSQAPECAFQSSCGNSVWEVMEECDDGNRNNTDGCDENCRIRPGWACAATGIYQKWVGIDYMTDPVTNITSGMDVYRDAQNTSCHMIQCGDGILEGVETCDDGNRDDLDGCSSQCQLERGFSCAGEHGAKSLCHTVCGDGRLAGNETCDDGNLHALDGCSAFCDVEPGYKCDNSFPPSKCLPLCGDGIRNTESVDPALREECDDSNNVNGDGCSEHCKIETGWHCYTDERYSSAAVINRLFDSREIIK
jgi:cysteine-rich repeat protein